MELLIANEYMVITYQHREEAYAVSKLCLSQNWVSLGVKRQQLWSNSNSQHTKVIYFVCEQTGKVCLAANASSECDDLRKELHIRLT